jgi:hypothetical protein
MKTSNVIGIAAAAALLTLLELGVGAALLPGAARAVDEAKSQLELPTKLAALEPVVVIGRSD